MHTNVLDVTKKDSHKPNPPARKPSSKTAIQRDRQDVHSAIRGKSPLTSRELLAAQRTVGNRAVQRLIQRKLQVGAANDIYEQEADRVANQVMSHPVSEQDSGVQRKPQYELQRKPTSISAIQRQSASGGFTASPEVQQSLSQSQGHGHALPSDVRAQFEQRFGRDFRNVQVHTEPQADVLNRSLNAQAFTSGSDIYFSHGQYNPGSHAGQHLLAHELTHVVQQSGGLQRKPIAVQRKGNKGQATTDAIGTTPTATVDEDESSTSTESEKKEENVFEQNGLEPEYENEDLKDTPATSYKFTLIAWRPGANYLPIQKLRAWSKMRNTVRAGLRGLPGMKNLVRKPKSGKEIKSRAFEKQGAKQAGYNASDDDKKRIIAQMASESDAIGHTWIRLSSYVGVQLKQISAYGFWPEDGFDNPSEAVDGEVMDPDHQHDKDSNVKALDTKISAAKFQAGVTRVATLKKSPPQYKLIGYNCTKFGKDIAGVTGGKFPGAGDIFPAEPSKGMLQRIFSPDELYGKMEKNKGSYDTLAAVPKKPSKFALTLSSINSQSDSESESEPAEEMPEVKQIYQCVMELKLTGNRGSITADAGTKVMVIAVNDRDGTITVEKERSGTNDFNTRGTCTAKAFWSSCIAG
ncbi:MAG TPA: DUF4157 domain-containing protein [Anaerolineae bacterium]